MHGHSIIATLTGELPSQTTGPLWQAGGRALAIDGGLYAGGPLLLVRLDEEEAGPDGASYPPAPARSC